ncbi:MAG: ABC transporter permease [bacterium]
MKSVLTIFKKEIIDTLRDRRTLIAMVLVPLLLIPVIMTVMTKVQMSQVKKAREEVLKVGLVTFGNAAKFEDMLSDHDDLKVVKNIPVDSVRALIRKDSLDGAFVFSKKFDEHVTDLRAGRLKFYYKSTEDENEDITKRRLKDLVDDYEKALIADRFKALNLNEKIVKPLNLVEVNVATQKERLGRMIGGFLPYLFIIFCFTGSMYPAIDLGAGEKERGTIETLLTAPVSRFQILLGKFGVVVVTGVASAAVSMVGLYLAIRQIKEIPKELVSVLLGILEVKSILLVLSLLLPLTIFFAGILLTLSIFAKSYKEAQSLISPLLIVVILPAVVGLLPGITLNSTTAWIPILNISLATKDIVSGTIEPGVLSLVYLSQVVLAGLSLFFCSKWFGREGTIFRY